MGKNKFTQSGMSLVEVMVTMGIASVMMLGVLQLVTYANKAGKNVAVTSDWGNLVNSVQQALNNDSACTSIFQGTVFVGAKIKYINGGPYEFGVPFTGAAQPNLKIPTVPNLEYKEYGKATIINGLQMASMNALTKKVTGNPIVKIGSYSNFNVDEIKIEQNQLQLPYDIEMVMPDDGLLYTFTVVPVELTLSGNKAALTKTTTEEIDDPENPGQKKTVTTTKNVENLTLGSQRLTTKQSIPFKVVLGPQAPNPKSTKCSNNVGNICGNYPINSSVGPLFVGTNKVYSCFGIAMASAQSCHDMGGAYDPAKPDGEKCSLTPLGFSGLIGPPGNASIEKNGGERIQLQGVKKGIQSPDDFGIGIDSTDGTSASNLWMNTSGNPLHSQFSWHFKNGSKEYPTGDIDQSLMRLKAWVYDQKPDLGQAILGPKNIELAIAPGIDQSKFKNASESWIDANGKWYATLAFGGKKDPTEAAQFTPIQSDTKIRSARTGDLPNEVGLDFITANQNRLQISKTGEIAVRDQKVFSVNVPDTFLMDDARISLGPPMKDDPLKSNPYIKPYYDAETPWALASDFSSFVQITRPFLYKGVPHDAKTSMLDFQIGGQTPLQLGLSGTVAVGDGAKETGILSYGGNDPNCNYKAFGSGHFLFPGSNCPSIVSNETTEIRKSILKFGGLKSETSISSVRKNGGMNNVNYGNTNGLDFYTDNQLRMSISAPGATNKPMVTIYGDLEVKGDLFAKSSPDKCGWVARACGKDPCGVYCPSDKPYLSSLAARCHLHTEKDRKWSLTAAQPYAATNPQGEKHLVGGYVVCDQSAGLLNAPINAAIHAYCCSKKPDPYSDTPSLIPPAGFKGL